jgi:hypothetical protein
MAREFMLNGDEGLLVFGEIDCRCHILKHMENETIASAVSKCIERYSIAAQEIRKLFGRRWSFYGPGPSNPSMCINGCEFDTVGTPKERNIATEEFNRQLKIVAHELDFGFVTIFDKLVDKDLNSLKEYFRDEIHINQKAWPFFKAELEKTR